jgi:rhodanese-related sulfurtransferase
MKTLRDITAQEATALLAGDAILVDVREPYEQAMERIAGAVSLPLSALAAGQPADIPDGRSAIFLCASGARTSRNSAALASLATGDAFNLAGGIAAWKRAGLPTERS